MYGPVRPLRPALLRKGVLRDAGRDGVLPLVQAENGSGAGIHSVGHLQSNLGRHARLPARHTGRSRRRKSPGREHVVLQRPHAPCPDDQRFADPENVERNGLRSVVLDGRRPPDALSGDGIVLRNGEKARLQLGAPDRRIFAATPLPGLPGRSGPESGRSQGRNFREVPALRFHAGRTVVGTAAAFGSGTVFRAAAALRTAPLSGQHCSRVSPVPGSADRSPAADRSPCGPKRLRLQHGPGGRGISGRIFRRTPGRRRCIPPCCPGRSRRVRLRERATAPFRPAWPHRADRPST